MVDSGTIIYLTKSLSIQEATENLKVFFEENADAQNSRYILKNPKKLGYEFINYVGISTYRQRTKIAISFSYSRYNNFDNYKLCENEKTVQKVHKRIVQIIQAITLQPVKLTEVTMGGLDISNQLQVKSVTENYMCLDIIFKILQKNKNGMIYISGADRKNIQGISFNDQHKKIRESQTYFKIYSKKKERLDIGKYDPVQKQALRGELTLKEAQLKRLGLAAVAGVNKKMLDDITRKVLSKNLLEGLQEKFDKDISELKVLAADTKHKERLLDKEYLIFDTEMLNCVITPATTNTSKRNCQYMKKYIIERLEEIESSREIKKVYKNNFKRLERILNKIFKVSVKFSITEKGVKIEWQE